MDGNLLYGWCAEYEEAVKCREPHLSLRVLQIVVAVPLQRLRQAPVPSCSRFCGGSLTST